MPLMSKTVPRSRASQFPRSRQWQVDIDYLNKLSPEDQEWMKTFLEAEYGGNGHLMFAGDQEEQRRLWRQQKKQDRDAMTIAMNVGEFSANTAVSANPEDALIDVIDAQNAREAAAEEQARRERLDAAYRAEKQRRKARRSRRRQKKVKQAACP